MKKITSALANKILRGLEDEKAFWVNKEESSSTYVAANNEEPVVPEYDYKEVADKIAEIDDRIAIIKHALNLTNATARIQVGDAQMSVDTILIKMAQLNKRKEILDEMRKRLPKERDEMSAYSLRVSRSTVPEYIYVNYDLDLVKSEYERVFEMIMEMQIALDRYNQTETFEVDI
ncbi:MAG: hypothetical protein LUE92_07725 [Clostridiales bacterium]|nr:hypothetical protein [Clostridiales bacterium]